MAAACMQAHTGPLYRPRFWLGCPPLLFAVPVQCTPYAVVSEVGAYEVLCALKQLAHSAVIGAAWAIKSVARSN